MRARSAGGRHSAHGVTSELRAGAWSILMRSKVGSNFLVYNANLADGSPSGGDSEPKRQALKTVVGKGVLPLRPAMRRYLEGKTPQTGLKAACQ